jgi:hypothetical protein
MPDPYYQDDHCTIYHGDCLSLLPSLEANVLLTDPPYGRAWKQGDTGSLRGWANDAHTGIVNDESTQVRDHFLAWWGQRPGLVFGDLMLSPPLGTKHVLIYDKGPSGGFTGAVGGWRRNAEAIYVIGQGWSSGLGGESCILATTGVTAGNLARIHGHPHTKPDDLCRYLIEHLPPGVILDPFMGSGTTLRAAKDLGRRAIGMEIEERYCEIAAKRLVQEVLFG